MSNMFIVFVNLLALSLSGHVFHGIKSFYQSRGAHWTMGYSFLALLICFSGTAAANVVLFRITEITP